MAINIIKGDSNLANLLTLYGKCACCFYGSKYGNLINNLLNHLTIYGMDDNDDDILRIARNLYERDLTALENNQFLTMEDDILENGIVIADTDVNDYRVIFRDDKDFETEINLIEKIFVRCLSYVNNPKVIINENDFLRFGFMFSNINNGLSYGKSFNEAYAYLFTKYICMECYHYEKDFNDIYKTFFKISSEVCEYIFNIESQLGNSQNLIDSYLTSNPFIWDIYGKDNFFEMSSYLDQIDVYKNFDYIKPLEKELTLYRNRKTK